MWRFFRSLRFRLIILVAAALLPALGVIVYNAEEDRWQATAAAQDQLRRLVALVAREQAQKTMAARHLLMGLAQAPAVRRQEAGACSALFAQLISKPALFINIGAIDRDGNIFASAVPLTKPLNTKHLRYFQKALETRDFAVGNLQFGRIVLEPVLIFSYPVLDAAGEVQTVLYASIRLDWLNHLAAQARLPAGSVLTIIDPQGAIMAKDPAPEKWVGKSLPPGGLFDLMQKHGQGVAEAPGMDGVPRLYAFAPLGGDPQLGFVFAGIPTRMVYAAADQALRRNLAILGGVLALALGLAWGLGYLFVMRRVNPLVQATARLAAGDLSARTGLTGGPDELNQLAQAFDHMAASLEAREAESRQAEVAIQRNEARLASLLRISQYPAASNQELLNYALGETLTVTGSKIGYLYQYDEATEKFTLISYSQEVMKECSAPPKDLYMLVKTGIWGEAVRQRRPIMVNDFQTPHPLKKGYPQGHAELYNYLTIPVFTDHRIVGVVGVANKATDYDQADVRQLTLMMESVWQIAERRRMEEGLQAAARNWQTTFDTLSDAVVLLDRESRIVQANRAFLDFLGKPGAEVVGRHCWEVVHGTEAPIPHCPVARMRESRRRESLELALGDRWFLVSVDPILDEAGEVAGAVHVLADITGRKQAEESRRQAEERFRAAFEFGPMGMALSSAGGRLFHVNRAFCEVLGYTAMELLNLTHQDLTHPQDRESDYVWRGRLLAGEAAAFDLERRYLTRQGEVIWASERTALLRYADGSPQFFITQVLDITASKRAEEALQESEALLREAQRIAHIGSWSMNLTDDIIRWSDELYNIYGVTKGEFLPTAASLLQLLHPDDRPLLERWIEQVIGNLKPKELDFRIILPDGAVRYIRGQGDLITDQAGKPERIAGTAQDITERKRAEAERDRLFNLSIDMLCIAGFDGYFKQLNPAWEKVLGWTDQELLAKPWMDFVHPEDRAATMAAGEQLAAGEAVYDFENRYQCRDGSYHWVAWNSFPLLEEGLVFCVVRDVTERKKAEEALRESEELYRSLFDNMLNGLGYFKMLFEDNQPQDFIYLSVNRAFETLTGLTNVVGKKVSEVIPGLRESNPGMFEIFGRVALTGKPERFEDYVEPLQMWFSLSVYSPAKEYFVVVFDVITDRKQAEAALQQRFLDLAALYAASKAFLGQLGVADTLTAACRLAVEQFGLRMAWVGFTDPGRDYLVRPVAVYGDEAGYLEAIQVTWDDSPTGCGPGGVTIRTRQAMVINDTETDPAFVPWREAALARGYRSVAGLPMFYEEVVVGTLLLYHGAPGYFAPDRIQVFQSLANQAAVALQKARLFEETQRYAAELEDRVAERTAQLESTNQELDRFAYSVSHDLRAPLRAMQGFSLALLEDYAGALDPAGQDFARRINVAAERMDRLIQDLLAYSRISREEMPLQPVSLEQTVAEAMANLEGDIQARQAQVRVEPPLPEVQAHHATLLQIVANLVSNAIKFTAPDVQPQVRLWAEDRGERVRLWVEDNGLGIAPEHQERIFRIFERLHGIEAYPGTGIGLAIVKKGVERMGGQVGVESELGQGSRFWVELDKAG